MTAGLAEREIAEFVDDDEIIAQQILGEPPAAADGFLLFELIDEIDQIEETSPGAGANDRRRPTPMQRWVLPAPGETATWRRDSGG